MYRHIIVSGIVIINLDWTLLFLNCGDIERDALLLTYYVVVIRQDFDLVYVYYNAWHDDPEAVQDNIVLIENYRNRTLLLSPHPHRPISHRQRPPEECARNPIMPSTWIPLIAPPRITRKPSKGPQKRHYARHK